MDAINTFIDNLLNFTSDNDFVAVVLLLAVIFVVIGFIFKAFLKAAIVTAIILAVLAFGAQYFGVSPEDAKDMTEDKINQIANEGKDYVENKLQEQQSNKSE